MSKFKFVFRIEDNCNVLEVFKEKLEEYHIWGLLNILVDNVSYFQNLKTSYINEFYRGTSSISQEGITVPIFPFVEAILDSIDQINNGAKKVIISEHTGQISKSIVCEINSETIKFAILNGLFCEDDENTWYDGKKVSKIHSSKISIVDKKNFIEGSIESIKEFLLFLLDKFPGLEEIHQFNKLLKQLKIESRD
ncbi:hypothetical protein [Bacillus suaedaesalsae]|uniref:Uncharacterized protein n=1 Tax=Bacillus suaedaesalsae TaxID=2810349 RepID=A0ABS2DLD4_9BACI|nr:hypothetical protein [Bacillus suaedaesalsae]MBM6619197.1 hypothetical protein [Bacillus suaedaesalsae]